MDVLKYSNRIITDAKSIPAEIKKKYDAQRLASRSSLESTHLLNVDGERIEDFFFVDCSWLWKGSTQGPLEEKHAHDYGEVIGFVGSSREDPHDLGGEVVFWLDGEKVLLNKSCLIFVPAGVPHCPVQINRIDRPIFFVTLALTKKHKRILPDNWSKKEEGKSPRYNMVTETKTKFTVAASGENAPPRFRATRLCAALVYCTLRMISPRALFTLISFGFGKATAVRRLPSTLTIGWR